MIGVLKKIWRFAGKEQANIGKSIFWGFFYAVFHMLQVAAIYFVVLALTGGEQTSRAAWLSLLLLAVSIVGRALVNRFTQLQQTPAGYFMVADRRVAIGDKLKRVPMGYFSDRSLGEITGVTTMFMGEGLDTGDILEQTQIAIGSEETAGELMDRLADLGAQLLLHTLTLLESGKAVRTVQDEALATYAPMLQKSDGELDFSQPAQKLHDRIRGVSPWPSAYSYLDGKRIKVHKSALLPDLSGESGVIQEGKRLIVGCGEGSLELLEVQPEGGKRMSGQDFLRGRRSGAEKKFTSCPSE